MTLTDYSVSLVYLGFFMLIGFAIYITQSSWCLLGLVFTPSYQSGGNKKDEDLSLKDD